MSKVKAQVAVSLDGYMAGPNQSEENPLGEGAGGLHEWIFKLASFRSEHGMGNDGERGVSDDVLRAAQENIGAVVMGRNMFGPVRGEWEEDWRGWWGPEPPYHAPVFVLTHHAREPIEMQGGTTFHFVTDGIEAALAQAKAAAGDLDVKIGGGVSTIRQCLLAGAIDEMHLALSPVVLGRGESLFSGIDLPGLGYRLTEAVPMELATHVVLKR